MLKISDLAPIAAAKIKAGRKAPKITQSAAFDAARQTAPPYAVIPISVIDHLEILRDGNALAVLIAITNHANKSGMTHCSQERLAALTRLSRKTIGRKLKKLTDAGLVKIEYRRPYAGSPKRLNVMRVIYDKGALTRQDVHSVTGNMANHPPTGQHTVPQVNGNTADSSTDQHPPMGLQQVPQVAMGQVSNPPMGQLDRFTYAPTSSPVEQPKGLNIGTHSNMDYTHDDVIKIWRASVRVLGAEAIPTEADHETIEHLRAKGVSLQAIRGEISDYCLEAQERQEPAPARLRSIVAPLLAIR